MKFTVAIVVLVFAAMVGAVPTANADSTAAEPRSEGNAQVANFGKNRWISPANYVFKRDADQVATAQKFDKSRWISPANYVFKRDAEEAVAVVANRDVQETHSGSKVSKQWFNPKGNVF